MNYLTLWHGGLLAASLFAAAVPAADLTVRVDAREVPRNRVHTDITLAVKPGRSRSCTRNGCQVNTHPPVRSSP